MFRVFQIMALNPVSRISLTYDGNTCERQSTCYQTVLRFHIQLKEMFSSSISLCLIENLDESAAVLISALFVSREHIDSPRVSKTGAFGH